MIKMLSSLLRLMRTMLCASFWCGCQLCMCAFSCSLDMCTAASFSQYLHLNACELGCLVAKWSIISVYICVLHFLHFNYWPCTLFRCCSRGSVKSRDQRGHSCFLPPVLDLFGDIGGGVTGSLSFDCGVVVFFRFYSPFFYLGLRVVPLLRCGICSLV